MAMNYAFEQGKIKAGDTCLLYTSDAADERSSVDLGGRRIIKKKKRSDSAWSPSDYQQRKDKTKQHNA